jgi:hypothetical protein
MRRELIRTRDRALLLGKTAHGRVTSFLLEMAERTASSDQIELPCRARTSPTTCALGSRPSRAC